MVEGSKEERRIRILKEMRGGKNKIFACFFFSSIGFRSSR
jgi:hypothetical protein